MAMMGSAMADSIRSSMGFPNPTSTQLLGWGNGIVQHIQAAAQVSNAPGTITGTCVPGSSLSGGSGSGGTIAGMSGSTLASLVASLAGYPFVSSKLMAFCNEIVSHIQSFGVVAFASGNITGTCTNTNDTPGTLVSGAGTGGTISGLSGSTLANAIHAAAGYPGSTSTKLMQFCTAIVNYIMANGEAAYASGNVTGVCPPSASPLSNGAGSNGTIA